MRVRERMRIGRGIECESVCREREEKGWRLDYCTSTLHSNALLVHSTCREHCTAAPQQLSEVTGELLRGSEAG